MDATTAIALLASGKIAFRPFTKTDFYGFAGVESANPQIGEEADRADRMWILDGENLALIDELGSETRFTLSLTFKQ